MTSRYLPNMLLTLQLNYCATLSILLMPQASALWLIPELTLPTPSRDTTYYGVSVRGSQSPVIGEIIEQATLCSYTEDIYGIVTPFQGKRILN